MRRIVHLSADYPDPVAPQKTRAIANLLALVPEHAHEVYSLNRLNGWRSGIRAEDFCDTSGDDHRAVAYRAPPNGLFLKRYLSGLADWIGDDLDRRALIPDLIHAHKLTIEGLIGARLSRRFGVPLVLSVQGNTDLKITRVRPDLRGHYRDIWHSAAIAFPFAPWAATGLDRLLGVRTGPVQPLPCPGPAEAEMRPQITGPIFRTAFHFSDAENKNAAALIRAIGQAAREVPEIGLEIIGGGDEVALAHLTGLAEKVAPGRVRFLGQVPNTDIQALFNASCAFALVSRRESFGMVFSEALQAGCPCLYPRGRAISGYFEDGSIVVPADPNDPHEITAGLVRLAQEEAAFKDRLGQLMDRGGLDFLKGPAIADTYRAGLDMVWGASVPRPG